MMKSVIGLVVILTAAAGLAAAESDGACPDLTGVYACPASERYKQQARTVEVRFDAAAGVYTFLYDGKDTVTVTAGAPRESFKKDGKESWRAHSCRGGALVTETFATRDSKKVLSWSRQRLGAKGDYEVLVTGGKVSMVCRRAEPSSRS